MNYLSRRYLATLAIASALVLVLGLLLRRWLPEATGRSVPPPSEAASLQQLSQEARLRRESAFVAERIEAVAPFVTRTPGATASSVFWGAGTLVTTSRRSPVVALPAPTAPPAPFEIGPDSVRLDWVLVVARNRAGSVVSAIGVAGGRVVEACGSELVEEYVLDIAITAAFAGAGIFDLAGRALGMVVDCDGHFAAIPAREVERLRFSGAAALSRATAELGLGVSDLDDATRAYFAADSGVLVTEVRLGSIAYGAGIRPGDIVVAVDGEPAGSAARMALRLDESRGGGHSITTRHRSTMTTVTLPEPRSGATASAPTGDGTATLPELGIEFTRPSASAGVELREVLPGSLAAVAGLRVGDRLLRVEGAAVNSAAAARAALERARRAPAFIVFERDAFERGVLLRP